VTTGARPLLLLAALLATAAGTGVVAVRSVARQQSVADACAAASAGRFADALERSEGLAGPDPEGRAAAVCRCRALQAAGRADACAALLDGILAEPEAAGWLPPPDLAALVVQRRRDAGDAGTAADLARRAAVAHPEDPAIHRLEIVVRGRLEGEAAVLEDLERRLAAGRGDRLGLRLDSERVSAVLGETPPPRGHPYLASWFRARAWALAGIGDLAGLRAAYAAWRERGGDPHALEADYALQLSIAQLRDPERSWIELFSDALEHEAELEDPRVAAALYQRWIGHLMARGELDAALRLYDRAAARYELVGLTREQIVQRRTVEALGGEAADARGTLAFHLPADAPPGTPPLSHGTLHVSPDVEAEPDAPYEAHRLSPGETLRVRRGTAVTPQRWVLRDADGRVRASGSAWPAPGATTEVAIRVGEPQPPARFERAVRPGDGRRRVFVLLPDCGDWRLVQYLRARGELPVFDALVAAGHRAVLTSDPPVTAAAMEKLVWPTRGQDVSFLGELNRLGLELAGLASVGRNPLGFLAAVLPEGESLFEAVGGGPYVAANLLFSHGGIDAGRHAVVFGPHGRERPGPALEAWRELTPAEAREWSNTTSDRAREHARTIAAEMDAALRIAREGAIDLTLLRIEPLDLLTHELFGELASTRQDDGRSGLLDAYRYLDRRTGELWNALDADDVLVVLSDHGARTVLEHSDDAIFVAAGGGITPGRAPGRPEIAGVPRALAALFGVERPWPATGVAASWGPTSIASGAPASTASASDAHPASRPAAEAATP